MNFVVVVAIATVVFSFAIAGFAKLVPRTSSKRVRPINSPTYTNEAKELKRERKSATKDSIPDSGPDYTSVFGGQELTGIGQGQNR